MNTYFKQWAAKLTFIAMLSVSFITPSFAAGPTHVYVHLHNGGGYVAGLFYKEPGASLYQQAGSWIPIGANSQSPNVPKGSNFCVSISVVANLAYVNYYYNSSGSAPDWYYDPVGNANLVFQGDLLFSGIQWGLNGAQSAGLMFERAVNTQNRPCPGY